MQIPILPLTGCVTLGELVGEFSALQFPLKIVSTSQDCYDTQEIINVKLLEQ